MRTFGRLLILWLVVELVLTLFGIMGGTGPMLIETVMLVLGITLVVALVAVGVRGVERSVEERWVVVRLVAASVLIAVANILSWDGFAGDGVAWVFAVLVVIPAVVMTVVAVVSYVRYVRGEPVSGPSIAWRVLGSVLVVLVGLAVTLFAGAMAGLAGFSCSGGVIGEGCGGGSWLAAIVVWVMLGSVTLLLAWSVLFAGDRRRVHHAQSAEAGSPPPAAG